MFKCRRTRSRTETLHVRAWTIASQTLTICRRFPVELARLMNHGPWRSARATSRLTRPCRLSRGEEKGGRGGGEKTRPRELAVSVLAGVGNGRQQLKGDGSCDDWIWAIGRRPAGTRQIGFSVDLKSVESEVMDSDGTVGRAGMEKSVDRTGRDM